MAETTTTPIGRLNRSHLLHFLNATPSGTSAAWFKIGKDVESMSVELNAEIETKKNILDETAVTHKGYEASASVETYYADSSDSDFYAFIKNIALGRAKGASCKTQVLEVLIDQTGATSHSAWREDCIIDVQSYGGEQGGVSIPYTIHFCGNRTAGTASFDSSTGAVTFTAAT